MGRGKVELKRIDNPTSRQVTFSKRRNGLLKKAFELSVLCDAEVALAIFSPTGKLYRFASHDMDRTISRYRNEVGLPNNRNSRTVEFWMNKMDELRRSIAALEARHRYLAGEDLQNLSMQELKQLERQIKTGVDRIRSKKSRIIAENVSSMKKRQRALQEENSHLQSRLHELQEANKNLRISVEDSCGGCTSKSCSEWSSLLKQAPADFVSAGEALITSFFWK